jgi:hypothetical protein
MKGFCFLISLGGPAVRGLYCDHQKQAWHRALVKMRDGNVLNEADKYELESLARQDLESFKEILSVAQRLRDEGCVALGRDLLRILDRARPGKAVFREHASCPELTARGVGEVRSVRSHSDTPSQLRHRGDRSKGTAHAQDVSNQTVARSQETESRSAAQDSRRAASTNYNPGRGRGTGLLAPGRQQGGLNSPASGSSQAPVTPRGAGAGAAQSRGSGTSPNGNQAKPQSRNQAKAGQSPGRKPSILSTDSPMRGNQRTQGLRTQDAADWESKFDDAMQNMTSKTGLLALVRDRK